MAFRVVDKLPADAKTDFAVRATNSLGAADKQEVAQRTGLGPPSPETNDRIWLVVVSAFAVVLLGAAVTLWIGRFNPITPTTGTIYTSTDTVVTLFTTASAFLIGLLVPSPIKKT